MLLDSQNLFSDDQAITTSSDSDNIIKFSKGDISYLPFLVQVTKAFSALTSLKISVVTSESEDFSSSTTLLEATKPLAELVEGAKFPFTHIPKGNLGYMKLTYTVEGTSETTGKITAGVVLNNDIEYTE